MCAGGSCVCCCMWFVMLVALAPIRVVRNGGVLDVVVAVVNFKKPKALGSTPSCGSHNFSYSAVIWLHLNIFFDIFYPAEGQT